LLDCITALIALFELQNLHALEMLTQSEPNQLEPIQLGLLRSPVASPQEICIDRHSNDFHLDSLLASRTPPLTPV